MEGINHSHMSEYLEVDCQEVVVHTLRISIFTINVDCEHVCMYKMLFSYTVCCFPKVSIRSIPEFPAVAVAIEARHGRDEPRRSAQGTSLWALFV